LTVIGEFAQAIIGREIHDSSFAIKTDKPRVKVSWQVCGIRRDAYAQAQQIPVEQEKPEAERGMYLHPTQHQADDSKQIGALPSAFSEGSSVVVEGLPTSFPLLNHAMRSEGRGSEST
jgi:hypothetical protein